MGFGGLELCWVESILLSWFCDVKFQNWLFASPISCLPRGGTGKRQWQGLVLAFLEEGLQKFCSPSHGCFDIWASFTWDPAHRRWLVSQCPSEDHSVPVRGQEAKHQDFRDWGNLRVLPCKKKASPHPFCRLGSGILSWISITCQLQKESCLVANYQLIIVSNLILLFLNIN